MTLSVALICTHWYIGWLVYDVIYDVTQRPGGVERGTILMFREDTQLHVYITITETESAGEGGGV